MIYPRSRPFAEALSVVLLAGCVFLLSALSTKNIPESPSHLNLAAVAVFAFNIPVLLSWIAFGIIGGIVVTAFSFLAVLFFDLRMGLYGYHVLTLSFCYSAFVGYRLLRLRHDLAQSHEARAEKADEEINLLTNELKERRGNIEALESKLDRYSLLKGVSESLSTVLSREAVNELVISETSRTIGKEGRVLLFLVDAARQDLMLAAARDESRVMEKKGDYFDHWVLRNRKSLIIEDVSKDFRFPADQIEKAGAAFRSLIAQPLIAENKVVGILRMDSGGEFEYNQEDLRLLDIMSDLAAVAVQNAYLYSRTQELALRDGLTGLFVRRFFMERFRNELQRAARGKGAVSLVMLDIDRFKEYNDRYGHTSGDLVLKHIAKTITGMVDGADVVGRYGGEEMVVLLCGKSKKDAAAEAEKIRQAVKEKPLTLRRQKAGLTVSLGVASYPADAVSEEELIRIADGRLYRAKTRGRDRVCSD
jgi:diguanylate cyclase (GGDEF)-like protein